MRRIVAGCVLALLVTLLAGCGYQPPLEDGAYVNTFYDPVNGLKVDVRCGKNGGNSTPNCLDCRVTVLEWHETP